MSHVILARKYRPKTFSEVLGQDLIVSTLRASVLQGRVAHALLFTGGRGIGKTTIARIVAKALVCTAREDADPCGKCAQCIAIDNFSSLDIVEIDGASHTGVDDIRDLRDSARYQPASAKLKIFIIDEVHMLSISAFNALLKILEEPPAHVMFMFATTEVHKIPKTILSRCQRYDFRRMGIEIIVSALKNILASEGFFVEDDGLRLIAGLADGSMRDALSMLEQIISEKSDSYSAELVAAKLGVVSHSAVKEIALFIIEGSVDKALLITKEVYDKGLDLCQLMDALAERFRALSLCAHMEASKALAIVPSLDDDDIALAKRCDRTDLKRLFSMAIDAIAQVFQAARPLLALELFILRASLRPPMSDALSINYCLQKLDAIMHNRPLPKEPDNLLIKRPAPKPVAVAQASIAKPASSKNVVEQFSKVIAELDKETQALASHLRHARPVVDITRGELKLYFEQSLHFDQVKSQRMNEAFQRAIETAFEQKLTIILELTKEQPPSLKAIKTVWEADEQKHKLEEKALYERAAENPLVKKALEIFGGDITSVRKICDVKASSSQKSSS